MRVRPGEVFSRHEPSTQRTIAKREQFPICLAYALTLHKAQGQELNAVEVDAKGVYKPGMLGVGVSRVRDLDGLRVLSYRRIWCQVLQDNTVRRLPGGEDVPLSIRLKGDNLDRHGIAGAKLRYVGGSVVARLTYRTKKVARTHLYDTSTEVLQICDQRLSIYDSMEQGPEAQSIYPDTLREITHKRTGKLFTPSDKAYEFFIALEKKRLFQHTYNNFVKYGSDMPGVVTRELLGDRSLRNSFLAVLEHEPPTVQQQEELPLETFMASILEGIMNMACSVSEARTDIVVLYMKSGNKTFRGEVMTDRKVKKKEAHRRKIMKRKTTKEPKKAKKSRGAEGREDSLSDDYCAVCGNPYHDGEPWVRCDGCAAWLEQRCTDITDDRRWTDITGNRGCVPNAWHACKVSSC